MDRRYVIIIIINLTRNLLVFFFFYSQYYGGNVDVDSVSISHLTTSLAARYVRIIPKAWHGCICLRLEVYVEDLSK